jgi:hypothetical protein
MYGMSTMIMPSTVGIVDTGMLFALSNPTSTRVGTTLLLLPTDAYNHYIKATGAVADSYRTSTAHQSTICKLAKSVLPHQWCRHLSVVRCTVDDSPFYVISGDL